MTAQLLNISGSTKKRLLFIVLFLSGITALIYQVIWIRKFGLIFGVHVFSMSTVLTAFMAGLALGSLLFGKLVDKKRNPVKVFLWLEIGIGLFAVLFPYLFEGLTQLYNVLLPENLNLYTTQLIRFVLAFAFLLIPTTLMGGTLPVIIKYFVKEIKNAGGQISNLYSINNLGAVIGAFLAGFLMIKTFGLSTTLYIGALLNFVNAVITYLVLKSDSISIPQRQENKIAVSDREEKTASYPRKIVRLALWVFAIEGFTTLAYEVVWSRILIGYSFDKTTYFYTTILMSFIFGLSLGSFIIRRKVDRIKNPLIILGAIEVVIGVLSVAILIFFAWLAPILIKERSVFNTWMETVGKDYIIFFILMSIPTTLMGMTYPIISKIYADNIKKLGNKMGTIGFLDTVGSILGSFIAGFVFIPFLGVVKSFLLIALINVIIGLLIWIYHPQRSMKFKIASVSGTLLVCIILFIGIPNYNYFTWWDKIETNEWWGHHYERVVYYDEGEAATVMVRQYPGENMRSLVINGHHTAYTTIKDLSVNRQLGYMPYILHPNPKKAMVVGFGLGATTNALVQPELEQVDVAEICPGVIKGASAFSKWNDNVVKHPKVQVHDEDGRSWLFMSDDKEYDIITSNAIHPRLSNNIYTRDFYKICRDKLADDGIICQWMPQNWISEKEYKACLKAFTDVFPHSTLWYVNEYSTHIIGSKKPINIEYGKVAEAFKNEKLKEELVSVGIIDPSFFLAQYFMSEEDLLDYVKDATVNTDDHPMVEFSKVINIAPVLQVMKDLKQHDTNYDVVISDVESKEKKQEVKKKIIKYSTYIRNIMNEVIEKVIYYEDENT